MRDRRRVAVAYAAIIAVIFIWAAMPSVKKVLIGNGISASLYATLSHLFGALAMLFVSAKQLKHLRRDYWRVAVPTGLCVGAAALLQALAYNFNTSPTNQAFLENLSCISVPILVFLVVRKRPSVLTAIACILCLFSSMVLAGVLDTGLRFSAADILNALAGLLYGVNIAFTGLYAKRFIPSLYVMLFVQVGFYAVMTVVLHFVSIGGAPVDPIFFAPSLPLLLAIVGIGVLASALCWTMRTSAMRYVSPTVVAVMMPFSAVVTAVIAVLAGQDSATPSLLLGAGFGLAAGLLSALGDVREAKRQSAEALTVRPLTADELPALTALFDYNDAEAMLAENRAAIADGSIDIFGLFRGDALLGELRVRYTADDDRLAVRGVRAYLYAFRVRPEHRGQGVGKHLLSSVIATLSERGCTEMTVGVEDDNPRARHIYESLGFTEKIARLTESYQGDEYSFDLLLKK